MMRPTLILLSIAVLSSQPAWWSQSACAAGAEPGKAGPKAQVGANTTNGTTTGVSGRITDTAGGGDLKKPDASQCKSFKGEAHDYCLYTLLPDATPPKGGS